MNLQTAKIVNPPSKNCWSQAYINGNLLLVIKIEEETEPSLKAREIISCFHETYASFGEGILEKLEFSLQKIQGEFKGIKLDIIVGVIWGDVLYLGILNKGKAVLLRNGSLATILEGKEGLVTASGFLKRGDAFILGTEKFFETVLEETLKTNLERKNPEEIVEVLAPIIHREGENGGVGAIIAKKEKRKGKLKQFLKPRKKKIETKEQRMMMSVAVVLAILLFISIGLGWQKRRKEKEKQKFNKIWEEITYKYEQGKELVEINPILARKLLSESLNLTKENQDYKQIKELEKEIEKELGKAVREYELSELPLFLDLGLIKNGLKGISLDFWGEEMIVLGEDGTVVKIDLNRKTEIEGKVEGGKLISHWGEKVFVLGEKIIEIGSQIEIEKEWGEIVGFETFAGNLYLLDQAEDEVWKYPVIEDGFGTRRSWFGPGVKPDLSRAVDFTIDGDVWILLADGKILKFTSGVPKAFSIAGLDREFNNPTVLYTNEDCQKLYLLDKGNKRIVVLDKSGEYDSQYIGGGIENVLDIVVSESDKKILLLGREKIYEIEIR